MDALLEKLDSKLREWSPEKADQVRERVKEVIELADDDVLDLVRSRAIEQEVLDLLDDSTAARQEATGLFRAQLPRLFELKDLCKDKPQRYFPDFVNVLCSSATFALYRSWEQTLQCLDDAAWKALKDKAAPRLVLRDRRRGWHQLFESLGEARAYNHLKSALGCQTIEFIPESLKEGEKTPDLKASCAGREVLCEAKTLNVSDDEIEARRSCGVRRVGDQRQLSREFSDKLAKVIQIAKGQIESYDRAGAARHLVYLIICFDDSLGFYHEDHSQQIELFLTDNPQGVEVFWTRDPIEAARRSPTTT